MAQARYTVLIPAHSRVVAMAAHHYLTYSNLPISGATVQHGSPDDMLIVFGEETPEMDSHMKQLGTYVGEVANVPAVTVAKEGKNVATWVMRNPHYAPVDTQGIAAPSFAQPSDPGTYTG